MQVNNTPGINLSAITGGMDLEAFMMTVQAKRANILESQMAGQIDEVKQRQSQIADLNQLLADVRALRPSGEDPEKWGDLGSNYAESKAMVDRLVKAGVSIRPDEATTNVGATDSSGSRGFYDAQQKSFDKWTEELKAKLDGLNSTSQLDMIRLQSISNKRNEAFEQMTNFVQKMAKSRDSIIGNMR